MNAMNIDTALHSKLKLCLFYPLDRGAGVFNEWMLLGRSLYYEI